jgi:hypothetical protein
MEGRPFLVFAREEAIKRNKESRPDLVEKIDLSTKADVKLLRELEQEQ